MRLRKVSLPLRLAGLIALAGAGVFLVVVANWGTSGNADAAGSENIDISGIWLEDIGGGYCDFLIAQTDTSLDFIGMCLDEGIPCTASGTIDPTKGTC